MTAAELAELPTVLAGSPAEVAEQIRAHRERFGLTYYTVLEHNMDQFAPVIHHLR
jgi:alkanesulfonate monooxygenase SsuD/methylene tetrahydromethanopterin reductase-like flavin-dependent oxidoreductase (luciferase family)